MNSKDIAVAGALLGSAIAMKDEKRIAEASLNLAKVRLDVALRAALSAGITQGHIRKTAASIVGEGV